MGFAMVGVEYDHYPLGFVGTASRLFDNFGIGRGAKEVAHPRMLGSFRVSDDVNRQDLPAAHQITHGGEEEGASSQVCARFNDQIGPGLGDDLLEYP